METSVVTASNSFIREEITEAKILEYLDSAGITNSLLANEKKMFINIAREFGLNPFKREIHITAYGEGKYRKCSIITGYEVYIKRAERTGKLDGWKVWTEGEGRTLKAVVEIYRRDQKYPFSHEVYYSECVQYNKEGHPNAIWAKQPRFMTKKVAIGQAFRLCFPDDLGGMPYEEVEIHEDGDIPKDEPRNVTNETGSSSSLSSPLPPLPPPPTPPNALRQQCIDLMNELKNIMLATAEDNSRIFTDDEYNAVKTALEDISKKFSDDGDRIVLINDLLNIYTDHLQTRFELINTKQPGTEESSIPEQEKPAAPAATASPKTKPASGERSLSDELREMMRKKHGAKQKQAEPAAAATQETTTAIPAADGFTDDIPGDEQMPAMYGEPETELVGADAHDDLNIF